jgi:hypothetical protein
MLVTKPTKTVTNAEDGRAMKTTPPWFLKRREESTEPPGNVDRNINEVVVDSDCSIKVHAII